MVVEVFISQRKPVDALPDKLLNAVLNARAITEIGKTLRQPRGQPDPNIRLANQHPTAVGTDATAIEPTRHRTPSQGVKLKLLASTLCIQGCSPFDWHKRLIAQSLCHEEQPFSTPSVRFPG